MTAHTMYSATTFEPVLREAPRADGGASNATVSLGGDSGLGDGVFVVDVGAALRRTLIRGVAVLAMIAVALFLFFTTSVQAGDSSRATEPHTVARGETLWVIAEDLTAPGNDVRATIADIKDLNGMSSSLVRSGQALIVPAAD